MKVKITDIHIKLSTEQVYTHYNDFYTEDRLSGWFDVNVTGESLVKNRLYLNATQTVDLHMIPKDLQDELMIVIKKIEQSLNNN